MIHRTNTVKLMVAFFLVAISLVLIGVVAFNPMYLYTANQADELELVNFSLPAGSKKVDKSEVLCLAKNIYYEARGESLAGKLAVGQVTLNRVERAHWPTTICGVVFERNKEATVCQFSWVCDSTIPRIDQASNAWRHSYDLAIQLLASPFPLKDITEGATYFHARYVNPTWAKQKVKIATIDNHIFYR